MLHPHMGEDVLQITRDFFRCDIVIEALQVLPVRRYQILGGGMRDEIGAVGLPGSRSRQNPKGMLNLAHFLRRSGQCNRPFVEVRNVFAQHLGRIACRVEGDKTGFTYLERSPSFSMTEVTCVSAVGHTSGHPV